MGEPAAQLPTSAPPAAAGPAAPRATIEVDLELLEGMIAEVEALRSRLLAIAAGFGPELDRPSLELQHRAGLARFRGGDQWRV